MYGASAKFAGIEKGTELFRVEDGLEGDVEDLGIGSCGPVSEEVQGGEDNQAAHETVEQIKDGRAHDDGEKEQASVNSEEKQRFIDAAVDRVSNGRGWVFHDMSPD